MALAPGARLGPYEILSPLGAGGMGEVYRARDTTLNREVAIKVLPDSFARESDRLARFTREAQTLASLNHPHIAQIYGLQESDGVRALVMELVVGEDLSQRIARGPILLEEALPIARQIADALEIAHEQGIIHRDLKPANIKLRSDGTVKVLDFGLAKLAEPSASGPASNVYVTQSPTITSPVQLTSIGVILGTAAYMSPEQAKGRPADKRADIWAFGVVLFEMLTGRRAYDGETISDVLAKVIEREPDWNALPSATPTRLRELLRRCVRKDPRARLRDIGDARVQIDELLGGGAEEISAIVTVGAAPLWRGALPWTVAAGSLLAAVVMLALWAPWRLQAAAAVQLSRFVITTSPDAPPRSVNNQSGLAISPDGSRVVYRSARDQDPNSGLLYMRTLDHVEAAPLKGADAANSPTFSRDGTWIVYADARASALKRISVLGGPPEMICSLDGGSLRGASWGSDDTIVFATDRSKGLLRVPAAGGVPERLTTADSEKGESHFWPDVLPDGRAVVFTAYTGSIERSRVAVLSLSSGRINSLLDGASARFSPTGHLVFAGVDRTLRAVGFDSNRLEVIGNPVTVVERIGIGMLGAAEFALTATGSLVYVTATTGVVPPRTLVWVNRQGQEDPINIQIRAYTYARLSPDGKRVAVDSRDEQNDIWIWDFARQSLHRLTTDLGFNRMPVWTPDSTRVAFTAERDGVESVYWQAADGSGTIERLSTGTQIQGPLSFSPDGKNLIFSTPMTPAFDLGVLSLGPTRTATMLLHSVKASETNGEISPDGRWLAYESDESGTREVYVRPFPTVETALYQVSTGGGTRPLWSRNGHELFYYAAPDTIMAVPVRLGADVTLGNPQPVVKGPYALALNAGRHYDVSADGERFLLLKDAPMPAGQKQAAPEIQLVLNWVEELKAKVPTK